MDSVERRKRARRARRRRRVIRNWIILILVLTGIIWGITFLLTSSKVKKKMTVEAGSELPTVSDFLKKSYEDVELISGLDENTSMNHVADYNVVISVGGKEYTSILHVVDTVAPVVTAKNATLFINEGLVDASELIESIVDATDTTVEYDEVPDMSTTGHKEIKLTVTDEGGNKTKVVASAEVVTDLIPPEITGVKEITIPAGTSVSYKRDVTVTDNYDTDVELTVDNSSVNLNEPGDYPITYIAVDGAGNETRVSTVLHVEQPSADNATEEYVMSEAGKLVESIKAKSGAVTQYDVAKAIYDWCHTNIKYVDSSDKDSWVKGAYRGLIEHKGDCYVYASSAKALLTAAGIENMDIERIPTTYRHYWNLINLGDGWYHFDTTRRKDGTTFFYWTDAQLMEYSKKNNDSHNYDASKYPQIQ